MSDKGGVRGLANLFDSLSFFLCYELEIAQEKWLIIVTRRPPRTDFATGLH